MHMKIKEAGRQKNHGKLTVTTVVSLNHMVKESEFMQLNPEIELIFDDKELDLSTDKRI